MCKVNPITKEHIEQMTSSLQKRLQNPGLSEDQRRILKAQLDYVVQNVREKPGVNA